MLNITLDGINGERKPFIVMAVHTDVTWRHRIKSEKIKGEGLWVESVRPGVGPYFSNVTFITPGGVQYKVKNVKTPDYDEPLTLLDILPDAIEQLTLKQCKSMGILSPKEVERIRKAEVEEQCSRN